MHNNVHPFNSEFQPNSNMKRFEITFFAPDLSLSANLKLTGKFFLLKLSAATGSAYTNASKYKK